MPIHIVDVMMMKVENVQPTKPIVKPEKVELEKKSTVKEQPKETPAAVYEKTEKQENLGHIYDKNTVDKLKKDSEKAYAYLKRIVEDMLRRQGKTLELLDEDEIIEVDETARLEAQQLIGPDGPLGAEAVSQRLVDFAIALSGGDKSKAETLRSAIEQGFKEAEKILGELPEISKETYKLTMEKFDAWVNEE